jgi:hypothetical protein
MMGVLTPPIGKTSTCSVSPSGESARPGLHHRCGHLHRGRADRACATGTGGFSLRHGLHTRGLSRRASLVDLGNTVRPVAEIVPEGGLTQHRRWPAPNGLGPDPPVVQWGPSALGTRLARLRSRS